MSLRILRALLNQNKKKFVGKRNIRRKLEKQ